MSLAQVPSAFLLTDVLLMCDEVLDRVLFKPDRSMKQTRHSLASVEAVKLKRMIGALRALWRSAKINGKDARLTALKKILQPSPRRANREEQPVEDEAEGEQPEEDEEGEDEEPWAALYDREAGPSGEEGSGAEQALEDGESGASAEEPSLEDGESSAERGSGAEQALADGEAGASAEEPSLEDGEASAEEGSGVEAALEDGEAEAKSVLADVSDAESAGTNSLTAPTLVMGETGSPSPAVEEEEHPDSQVSSGWLGKAYTQFNKQENELEELRKLRSARAAARDVLGNRLEHDMEVEVAEGYVKWSKKCIDHYGDHIYEHLCQIETYSRWLDAFQEDSNYRELGCSHLLCCVLCAGGPGDEALYLQGGRTTQQEGTPVQQFKDGSIFGTHKLALGSIDFILL